MKHHVSSPVLWVRICHASWVKDCRTKDDDEQKAFFWLAENPVSDFDFGQTLFSSDVCNGCGAPGGLV
jgi:hypothetical protein